MDSSTSTASLLLFPTFRSTPPTSPTARQAPRQYQQLQLTASLPLPAPAPPPKDEQYLPRNRSSSGGLVGRSKLPTPINGFATGRLPPSSPSLSVVIPNNRKMTDEEEKEERKKQRKIRELTSWRSEDGLLSPPPMPQRKLSSGGNRRRSANAGVSSPPKLHLGDLGRLKRSQSTPNLSLGGGEAMMMMDDLSLSSPPLTTTANMSMADLSAASPKRNKIDINRPPPMKRPRSSPSPYSEESLIKAPSPSLLRPKSFWSSHPRSALYQPSSYLVRRGTFIAAGLDIDECAESPLSSASSKNCWSASSLARAVESRTTEMLVCVPGSEF